MSIINPTKLAGDSEHSQQVALFAYANIALNLGFNIADKFVEIDDLDKARNWPGLKVEPVPCLTWFHAIPNGGSRGDNKQTQAIRGSQLKAEGVKSGVLDTFLPYPITYVLHGQRSIWHGLYIEMKKPALRPKTERNKSGGLKDSQQEFIAWCNANGYAHAVCYTWVEAVDVLQRYIYANED